ncbi:threonine/serine exporter family protein [Paraflavisolibacter sp. H34]|uniref:threonine/serine ThrE exporter family protein n=1 Tax=Huijunlia imazamoxiresistens TaxID=3127457 RepID=UPI00301864D8
MKELQRDTDINELGATLLEIGALLMSAGANTGRIRTTIHRISGAFGYQSELLIQHRALVLSISDDKTESIFNRLKRTSPHGVNFRLVSGISRMSWQVVEEGWSLEQINGELQRLRALPHYPRLLVLALVGLAGASFCRLAGGSFVDMPVVFLASATGLFVRQEAAKKEFNPYLCIYFAALTASLIAGLPVKFGGSTHEQAFATSVLFLIPGVPLINSFSDLIDGNLQNGVIRGFQGFIISFTIALGLMTTVSIYHF